MRVGVDRNKYQIHIPLPPKIDPTVTMMQVRCYLLSLLVNKDFGDGAILITLLWPWAVPLAYTGLIYPYYII